MVLENFIAHTPIETRVSLETLEEDVFLKRTTHPHSEVDGEMVAWIPNIRSSWSRETIDLYRHMKALLSRALTEKQVVHNGFSMQLKCIQLQIKVLHKKVSLLV